MSDDDKPFSARAYKSIVPTTAILTGALAGTLGHEAGKYQDAGLPLPQALSSALTNGMRQDPNAPVIYNVDPHAMMAAQKRTTEQKIIGEAGLTAGGVAAGAGVGTALAAYAGMVMAGGSTQLGGKRRRKDGELEEMGRGDPSIA